MTKRKNIEDGSSPLQLRLFRLRWMALNLESTELSPDEEGGLVPSQAEREDVVLALRRIGHGEDPTVVLGIKAKRGQRRKLKEAATMKKGIGGGPLSPLQLRLADLQQMALNFALAKLSPSEEGGRVLSEAERSFLTLALWDIGDGQDPAVVLRVKAKRGERRSLREAAKSDNIRFAMSWVAAVTKTERRKYFTRPGIPLDDAFAAAAEHFGYEEESLRTLWFSRPELRSRSFNRPITSLP
jgi:hypothetical protein